MRKHSLLAASTLALVTASTLAPSLARAACSEPAGRCGEGEGKGIKYAHPAQALTPGVGFTWQQESGYGALGFYGRIRAGLELAFVRYKDPVKGDDYLPLFTVDLAKAPVAATWSAETKKISIKRVDPTQEIAKFEARYTLRPQAFAALDTGSTANGPWTLSQPGSLLYYAYDLTGAVGDVLGNDNFGIHGDGDKSFAPWGLTGFNGFLVAGGAIPAGPLDPNSALFNMPWSLGDAAAPDANGSFGVYVQSNPEFSYKTLSVQYGDVALDTETAIELPLQSEYGDSVKVPVKVRGGARVDGNVQAKPFLYVQQVFGINLNTTLQAGFQQATANINIPALEDEMLEFDFSPAAEVEIPIPNVKVVQSAAEFTGTVGSEGSTKVTIKNEGKAPAKITFEADGDFQISSQATEISPGASFELTVRAKPSEAGTVTGTVKIGTNDPDSPLLELGVNGEFSNAPTPPNNNPGDTDDDTDGDDDTNGGKGDGQAAEDSSGCGCKTAGASPSSSLGALGALALGMAALIRRRRKN